jgi:hypothetical protein
MNTTTTIAMKSATKTTYNHYLAVSSMIAQMMNDSRLAFKTFSLAELDEIVSNVTGEQIKLSNESLDPEKFEDTLRDVGFICHPEILDAIDQDGQVRVYRAGSIVSSLLTAVQHPGNNTDATLASLLIQLNKLRRQHEEEHFANTNAD